MRKPAKKEKLLAARVSPELYKAVSDRAYEEQKSASAIIVEALRKYLNFKMPPRDQEDLQQ